MNTTTRLGRVGTIMTTTMTMNPTTVTGTTTRFRAHTESGELYHCRVGGSISLLGRSVSEAVCTPGRPLNKPSRAGP